MSSAKDLLIIAEKNLAQAEIVRMTAIKAVELAKEAVILESAGVAAALLITAAEEAAKAIAITHTAALQAWESAASHRFERRINSRS